MNEEAVGGEQCFLPMLIKITMFLYEAHLLFNRLSSIIIVRPPLLSFFCHAVHFLLAPLPYDGFSVILPFFFADPKLMERAQARQDTATKPTSITSLSGITRRMNFDMGEFPAQLVAQTVSKSSKQTSAA